MARNQRDSSSSRVTKSTVQRAAPKPTRYQQQQARRQMWVKAVAAFLVLAMLAPVLLFLL